MFKYVLYLRLFLAELVAVCHLEFFVGIYSLDFYQLLVWQLRYRLLNVLGNEV